MTSEQATKALAMAAKVRDLWEAGRLSADGIADVVVMSDFCAAMRGEDSKIVAIQFEHPGKEAKA